MLRSLSLVFVVGPVAVLAIGCVSNPVDVDIVAVNVVGDVVIGPDQEAVLEVTAQNRTNHRVVWGMGSSSCQLGLIVLIGRAQQSIDFRGCTDDLVEQGLDPRAQRAETFVWDGQIFSNGQLAPLPPGRYRVFGIAGDQGVSASLEVTIVTPQSETS